MNECLYSCKTKIYDLSQPVIYILVLVQEQY